MCKTWTDLIKNLLQTYVRILTHLERKNQNFKKFKNLKKISNIFWESWNKLDSHNGFGQLIKYFSMKTFLNCKRKFCLNKHKIWRVLKRKWTKTLITNSAIFMKTINISLKRRLKNKINERFASVACILMEKYRFVVGEHLIFVCKKHQT